MFFVSEAYTLVYSTSAVCSAPRLSVATSIDGSTISSQNSIASRSAVQPQVCEGLEGCASRRLLCTLLGGSAALRSSEPGCDERDLADEAICHAPGVVELRLHPLVPVVQLLQFLWAGSEGGGGRKGGVLRVSGAAGWCNQAGFLDIMRPVSTQAGSNACHMHCDACSLLHTTVCVCPTFRPDLHQVMGVSVVLRLRLRTAFTAKRIASRRHTDVRCGLLTTHEQVKGSHHTDHV